MHAKRVTRAIAEQAWKEHHPIHWHNARILDRANKIRELKVKEALHIQTPEEHRFNRDVGLELSGVHCAGRADNQ